MSSTRHSSHFFLMKLEFSRQIFEKYSNIKFHAELVALFTSFRMGLKTHVRTLCFTKKKIV